MKSHRMTALAKAAGMAGIAMIGIAGCGQPGPASGADRRAGSSRCEPDCTAAEPLPEPGGGIRSGVAGWDRLNGM
jgi:hypothetical protein